MNGRRNRRYSLPRGLCQWVYHEVTGREHAGRVQFAGKPLNSYGLTKKIVYENEEFNLLQAALNIENGIEELRYNNIIIATDADVDGMHIRLLLLTFFCNFSRMWYGQDICTFCRPRCFGCGIRRRHAIVTLMRNGRRRSSSWGRNRRLHDLKVWERFPRMSFGGFIGKDIRLEPVRMTKQDPIGTILSYYMGKNTNDRQDFIIDNLYVEKDEI